MCVASASEGASAARLNIEPLTCVCADPCSPLRWKPAPLTQLGSCCPIEQPPSPCSGQAPWHPPPPAFALVSKLCSAQQRGFVLFYSRALGAGGAIPPRGPGALVSLQRAAGLGLSPSSPSGACPQPLPLGSFTAGSALLSRAGGTPLPPFIYPFTPQLLLGSEEKWVQVAALSLFSSIWPQDS